ncbi:hypothetical protein C4K68_22475 [Pokkaliibacter plantistimulans]|uniref:Transglycosylase SLT domain-containing protein n=1 Tax=Proteobacteria bacterium 228 TaxID=2083153 RepID=A0A2S5KJU8_9PROT|nr:lytic transglycosylase domain-containing protein [Pokkaliibacter plantistimulans]PPC75058.1 hypothetical protein C4K68_22475 [Pokkaliibacter plantistimulans]
MIDFYYPAYFDNAGVPFDHCFADVTRHYEINPEVILTVLMTESGYPGAKVPNKRTRKEGNQTITYVASYDLGRAQINSVHLTSKGVNFPQYGVTEEKLRWNDCISISASAFMIRYSAEKWLENHRLTSVDDWFRMIASYNSMTPKYNEIYAARLKESYAKLQSRMKQAVAKK